jgi:hypothetical protein
VLLGDAFFESWCIGALRCRIFLEANDIVGRAVAEASRKAAEVTRHHS